MESDLATPTGSSIELWQRFSADAAIAAFFKGTFHHAGVRVTDTDESFSCEHRGDHFELSPGIDEDAVDFVVEIERHQVERFASEAASGELSELGRFRALRTMFTPATRATLKNPVMSSGRLRRLSRIEDLIHVRLLSPAPEQEADAEHTLVHAADQWLVIAGLHGTPRRIFQLSSEQALEYQRRVIATMRGRGAGRWLAFRNWYLRWRRDVSTRATG